MLKLHNLALGLTLLLALSGHSWSQSQQPSPAPEETTNQNQTPRNANQARSDADQRGTEQSPFFVKIIGAEPKTENVTEGPKSKDERNTTDWWMFWATVGIGFIGFLQLIAFTFQAIYMHRTVAEVQETTGATIMAARATEAATNAAKSASEDQLRFGHQIERAYISAGGWRRFLSQPLSAGSQEQRLIDTGKFEFHVNNYGKTSGIIFQIGWGFCERTAVPDAEPTYHLKYFNSQINPGTSGLFLHAIDIPQELAQPAIFGRVYYETIFGDRFSTGFLYSIPPVFGDSESIAPPNPRYTDERREN